MTNEMSYKFRSLTSILVAQGINIWDARIKARKLLNVKMSEPWKGRKPKDYNADNDRNRPELIPTVDDRLELYSSSVESTCKSIADGTAEFRTLGFGAYEFNDYNNTNKNRAKYSPDSKEFNYKGETKKSYYKPLKRPKHYWKMVRVLEANGMNYDEAQKKAQNLLLGEKHNMRVARMVHVTKNILQAKREEAKAKLHNTQETRNDSSNESRDSNR